MRKRVFAALAVLAMMVLGVGCSDIAASGHTSYWETLEISGYDSEQGCPEGYFWVNGTADMAEAGEMTFYYLTLAEAGEARIDCSLARNRTKGDAALYWEDPEGELTQLRDMTDEGGGLCTLPKGTSRFLVRADKGRYEVGMGVSGISEENILYLGLQAPEEEG